MSAMRQPHGSRSATSGARTAPRRDPSALPEVLILGTGAMAKLFGARLVRHGVAEVTLAGRWREAVDSMAEEGIVVEEAVLGSGNAARRRTGGSAGSPSGEAKRAGEGDAKATDNPSAFVARVQTRRLGDTAEALVPVDLPAAGFDLVLVLVKSHQTRSVAPVAAQAVAPHGRILTLQNGVGNREALAAVATKPAQVSAGVTTAGATGLGPNRVRAGGPGLTVLGAGLDVGSGSGAGLGSGQGDGLTDVGGPSNRLSMQAVAEMFRAAGFETETAEDIDALLWRKLVVNCAINPLTALHGIPNGALLEDDGLRRRMGEAAREVVAVAAALGIQLGDGFDPVAAAETVARKTRGNRSSMLQDMDRGARTEIDAICGAVVREGERLGVPTPVNAALWESVRAREPEVRDAEPRNAQARASEAGEPGARQSKGRPAVRRGSPAELSA